jgi:hypothetical protein
MLALIIALLALLIEMLGAAALGGARDVNRASALSTTPGPHAVGGAA